MTQGENVQADHAGDIVALPVTPNPAAQVPTGWICTMKFVADGLTIFRPSVQDEVEELLTDHVAGTKLTNTELSVSCTVYEDVDVEAAAAADRLAAKLLEMLGLPVSSLRGPLLDRYRPLDEYFAPTAPVIPLPINTDMTKA